jgi:hypothetical protein
LEDLDHGVHPLDRPEVGQMNDQLVVFRGRTQPRAQIGQIAAAVIVALEKVRNDANLTLDRQGLIRVASQAIRHRSHAV